MAIENMLTDVKVVKVMGLHEINERRRERRQHIEDQLRQIRAERSVRMQSHVQKAAELDAEIKQSAKEIDQALQELRDFLRK